jgi:hypothetical protein
MSNELNDFDQVFRDRLSGHAVTPPSAVWDNIQSKRTFGHVVANRISNNWRILGTLLMLLLAGGSSLLLFGEEELEQYTYRANKIEELVSNDQAIDLFHTEIENNVVVVKQQAMENKNFVERSNVQAADFDYDHLYPSLDELASLAKAGFVRPHLKDNENLSAYIENLHGWGSARPKAFTRFYKMDFMQMKFVNRELAQVNPGKVEIDYDYVMPRVERKTFWERSSFIVAITPHTVHKSMRAKYNLSSSYLRDREKAENTRLAYTVSGLFQYELTRHRFIESGINYTQIYEEMHFEGKKRFSNQYNFVEVPLLLGFQNRNSKWGWQVKGGLGLQIMNSYKGYILKRVDVFGGEEPELLTRMHKGSVKGYVSQNHNLSNRQSRNEVANLENEEENPFKANGVVNIHLAAGVTYFFTERTSFLVTPSFRRSINSITKEEARFTEKLQYMGISFGTSVKF